MVAAGARAAGGSGKFLVGGACFAFVFGVYAYSMRAVKQTGITTADVEEFKQRVK